jgi:peptidoglycan-N-acetylglucosamine deacetylase
LSIILASQKIPATYFLIADSLWDGNVSLYKREYVEVGLHTHRHDDYRQLNRAQKKCDLQDSKAVFQYHGLPARYFRPAYGIIGQEVSELLTETGLRGILWSIDSHDWAGAKGKQLVDRVMANLTGGSIILLHDRVALATVKELVARIQAAGYRIVALSKILEYPRDTPPLVWPVPDLEKD